MSTATAAFTGGFNWFKTGITAGVLVVAAMLFAVAYLACRNFQEWLMASLAVAWVVAAGYGLAVLLAAVYRPSSLLRGWRWWSALAIVAVIAVGGLTFWQGDSGASYTYGMAGRWGYALTGGHLWMWLIQLLGGHSHRQPSCWFQQAWKGYLITGRFIGVGRLDCAGFCRRRGQIRCDRIGAGVRGGCPRRAATGRNAAQEYARNPQACVPAGVGQRAQGA